jgi:hypothetical protein
MNNASQELPSVTMVTMFRSLAVFEWFWRESWFS